MTTEKENTMVELQWGNDVCLVTSVAHNTFLITSDLYNKGGDGGGGEHMQEKQNKKNKLK